MQDQWLRKPDRSEAEVRDEDLIRDVQIWLERLNTVVQTRDLDQLEEYKTQLSQYRKDALARNGEWAHENLVYKTLRNLGVISSLMQAILALKDQDLSI
jgi:bifunctional DNA-binding transcriptional regulator/antitoxin component of YhaV-PrlF toxin-antitoxin module